MVRLYACFFLAVLCTTQLLSQAITGNLEGWILTSGNIPLADVNIVARSTSLQGERGSISNKDGYFRIVALPIGTYNVEIDHISYRKTTIKDVKISLGKTTTLGQRVLLTRSFEIPAVTVTMERPVIDPTTTTTGLNLENKEFETLPVGRNYRSLTALVPSANTSFYGDGVNIAGSSGVENVYYVDGVNTTQPSTLFGSANLPYNFVREVEVKTGGYEAEYGSAIGGVVNVITRSGTNRFSGTVFGFFTNNDFTAQRRVGEIGSNVRSFASYDAGFSLQGPLVRDRLWFYAAYNPTVETEDINIPNFGVYRDQSVTHLLSGKLTWKASEKIDVVFSVFGDPGGRDRIRDISESIENPDVFLVRDESGDLNYSLNTKMIASEKMLIEANVARIQTRKAARGATERGRSEPVVIDFENNRRSGGIGLSNDEKASRTSASLKASFFVGRHTLKAGIDFENNVNRQQFLTIGHGEDGPQTIGGMGLILRFSSDFYLARGVIADHKVGNRIPAFFVQDAWQIHPHLLLRAGLRVSKQYLIGADGKVAQTIENEYQPRVGFVWQPGKIGSQKIHASYGRFYQKFGTGIADFLHSQAWEIVIRYNQNPLEYPTSGDTVYAMNFGISEEVNGLEGQYIDEFTLGYERAVGKRMKLGIIGIYRNLGQAVEDFWDSETNRWVLGNPGKGDASFLPELTREYRAVQLFFQKFSNMGLNFFLAYTLSRSYGNYPGVFNHDTGSSLPNLTSSADSEEFFPNSTGLLPNDRTHVLKFWGTYRFRFGIDVGSTFTWQSGTPLNNWGATSTGSPLLFLQQRGTAGRTPDIWDLALRVSYNLRKFSSLNAKLILDLLHIGNPRTAVEYDQVHFFARDENGNQIAENPKYLTASRFQSPFTFRLGMEVGF